MEQSSTQTQTLHSQRSSEAVLNADSKVATPISMTLRVLSIFLFLVYSNLLDQISKRKIIPTNFKMHYLDNV